MIISRTPYRISLLGGGTDFPSWYRENGGAVIVSTIDKFCYISCRYLPPFFEHRIRVVYSKIENCQTIEDIKHPAVRAVLEFIGMDKGIEIHHDGDLPARSGIGSSSAFTVGLLHALYALKGVMPGKRRLANESVDIEQKILGENVGEQDQFATAFGGFNHIKFMRTGEHIVTPISLAREHLAALNCRLMIFFTGIKRTSSEIAGSYRDDRELRARNLGRMELLVEQGLEALQNRKSMDDIGRLLHESWLIKQEMSERVSNSFIDEIYREARASGAIGGKIVGAGGGGFLLLYAPLNKQKQIQKRLNKLLYVPFSFEFSGSQIIFCDYQVDYSKYDILSIEGGQRHFVELNALSPQQSEKIPRSTEKDSSC